MRLRLPTRRPPTPAPCRPHSRRGRRDRRAMSPVAIRAESTRAPAGARGATRRQAPVRVPREYRARVPGLRRRAPSAPSRRDRWRPALPGVGAGDRGAARCPSSSCGRTHRTNSTAAESIPRCRCPARARSGPRRVRRLPHRTTRRWCAWCPTGCWWLQRSGCRSASRRRRPERWSCRRSPHPRHAAAARLRRRRRAHGPMLRRRRWCACLPSRTCP